MHVYNWKTEKYTKINVYFWGGAVGLFSLYLSVLSKLSTRNELLFLQWGRVITIMYSMSLGKNVSISILHLSHLACGPA